MKPALIVFDWAGTLIDFGCCAPLVAFTEAFEAEGLPIDDATARKPMGAKKRDHVREILREPEVAERATRLLGHPPDEAFEERLYAAFERRLLEVLPRYAAPIPGAVEALQRLRTWGLPLAGTTGYTRAMMERVLPAAAEAGLALDAVICADEVPRGRPAPWACFRLAERFDVFPLTRAVKVGDTPADMAEGRNAGMRCIGVDESGNEVGLGPAQLARLREAGAEHVLRSVSDLPAWIEGELR
jgi:phosphonoacetaldehyde hydrolase